MTWWLPLFAINAYAARGLKDVGSAWTAIGRGKRSLGLDKMATEWRKRSDTLRESVVASLQKSIRRNVNPPYVPIFPGSELTFWESMQKEKPSPQQWAHRAYAELLPADVLPAELANAIIDCIRASGATTISIVA